MYLTANAKTFFHLNVLILFYILFSFYPFMTYPPCPCFACSLFPVYCILGKLVLTAHEKKGFGGAMTFNFSCYGCWLTTIDYKSSQLTLELLLESE